PLPPAAVEPHASGAPYGHAGYPDEAAPPPPAYRDPPQQGYREQQAPQGYEPAAAGTRPYYGSPTPNYSAPAAGPPAPPPRPRPRAAAAADHPRLPRCGTRRAGCEWRGDAGRSTKYGGLSPRGAARDGSEKATAAAVPAHARRLLYQGAGRHDHHRHAEHVSL